MSSKTPITDAFIAKNGPNLTVDLCRMFEEKYAKAMLDLLVNREYLKTMTKKDAAYWAAKEEEVVIRVIRTMSGAQKKTTQLSKEEIAYWTEKHNEAFERLKLPQFRNK